MSQAPLPDEYLFSLYFRYVSQTEPPMIHHRWSLISCMASLLGRQIWFNFGAVGKIYPNMYVMLVGEPGTRKSTAIKIAKRLLSQAGYENFSADRSSKEKFLLDLEGVVTDEMQEEFLAGRAKGKQVSLDDLSAPDPFEEKHVFVVADEFNAFLGNAFEDFMLLFGTLWDWDNPEAPYSSRLKNSRSVKIFQPTINILGGNTQENMQALFPGNSIGQGVFSRFLLVQSDASGKKITFPVDPPASLADDIVSHMQRIKQEVVGPMEPTGEAKLLIDKIYHEWPELPDMRFRSYYTRRLTHLIKLMMVLAAMQLRTTITLRDVLLANTILAFTERAMPKAIGELGNSRQAVAANKLLAALYTTNKPMKEIDLWKVVRNDLESMRSLGELLNGLIMAEKIVSVPKMGYLAKTNPLNTVSGLVQWNLVPEFPQPATTKKE